MAGDCNTLSIIEAETQRRWAADHLILPHRLRWFLLTAD